MKTMLDRRFFRRLLPGLIIPVLVFATSPRAAAQGAAKADPAAAHEQLWNEAGAAVLALAAIPDAAKEPIEKLRAAQARLERAVVRLIGSQPPVARVADHLFLLPVVQEVAAAALAVVDARNSRDEPALASACTWLGESLARLAAASRTARRSTASR